jgi:hypothetical protein
MNATLQRARDLSQVAVQDNALQASTLLQGLQSMMKFETEWNGATDLRLSKQAMDTLAACVDTFGKCITHTNTLTKQMAILEPINDHAFSLPVRHLSRVVPGQLRCHRVHAIH